MTAMILTMMIIICNYAYNDVVACTWLTYFITTASLPSMHCESVTTL